MKRFTDTEKWNDQWFRKLEPRLKCLWNYCCDTCDASGVFEVDWELASFRIGVEVKASDLTAFGDRIETLPKGKYLLTKFIPFQYGQITPDCRGQRQVINAIMRNGLYACSDPSNPLRIIGYAYSKDRIAKDAIGRKTGSIGSGSVQGGVGGDSVHAVTEIANILRKAYRRSDSVPLDYFEEFTLAEIVRGHPNAKDELQSMLHYRDNMDDRKFFPKSMRGLLESWNKTLDAAMGAAAMGGNGQGVYPGPNL